MWFYAVTVFLSAFLLFQVQPLLGKWILPWFGGGSAVWTTCMLFFQTVLLAGYAYAHWVRTRLGARGQALVHAGVLVAAVLLLPIAPSDWWKPDGSGAPTWRILGVLAMGVGLPYFVLAATSPLLQAWFSEARPGASPYRLYALSNAGSLLALASYPFLVEPALGLGMQSALWSAGFAAFAVLGVGCAVRPLVVKPVGLGAAVAEGADPPPTDDGRRPALLARLLWLALPACGSVLLLAVTNQMCSDVGALPFLWVLPLALYLASFILCFQSDRIYRRAVLWPLLVLVVPGFLWLLEGNIDVALVWQIAGYGAGLFVCCMVCHGELARLKPGPRHLTSFYLMVSAGGALGGVFVALVAPLVFRGYFELHVGLWTCYALAIVAYWYGRGPHRRWRWTTVVFSLASSVILAGAAIALVLDASGRGSGAVDSARNFYGVLQVTEYDGWDDAGPYYSLRHGSVLHGSQYLSEPLRRAPTTYYGETSGVGLALGQRRGELPMRVGVVGLGVGTIAAYGRPGDVFRFYEINPDVLRLATTRFTYLADSEATCDVVLGDARLSLERQPPQAFDVLALDAFSGDAIPLHLLTAEACAVYLRHLKPDGVLAVHISNRFLDLKPVVLALAECFGLSSAVIDADDEGKDELSGSLWVLLTRDRALLEREPIQAATSPPDDPPAALQLWTDERSDLFSILVLR